ncbi:IPT/TIG domain-containing protein, partial [Candidatus Saccharibacteria bacterium]|nr:IPT/TIG domain-containing protein [Candidatus Saccharibacteria bacterium]
IDPTPSGALGTDCATITTSTNNPTGYSTTLAAEAANLVCTADSGTYNLTPANSTPAALGNNQRGYYIGTDTPSAFQAVPTAAAIIQSNALAATGDSLQFWIGAQVDYSQPPCTYTGAVTMTASPNPVPAPTITAISPASGSISGGIPTTITGSNFGTTDNPYISQINIGGASCLFLAVVDNDTATCITPAGTAGSADVSVDGYGGTATLSSGFTYQTPQANTCMPGDTTTAGIRVDLDANMFPVTFTGTSSSPSWAIADNSNWCSYSSQQWANAVTVTDPAAYAHAAPGTNVPESDVLGYWVYIPRYAYEVQRYYAFNAPVAAQNFDIAFETAITVKKTPQAPTGSFSTCFTAPNSSSFSAHDYRTDCGVSRTYGAATGTTWATHPAFTFNGQELNGLWIGKFETSGTRAAPQIKPNQNTNIGEYPGVYFDMGKAIGVLDNSATGGNGTAVSQNSHSLAAATTHMALNTDWGAAVYLAASQYGAGYNAVQLNAAFGTPSSSTDADGNGGSYLTNDLVGITGCGPSAGGTTSTYSGGTTLNTTTLQSPTACSSDTSHAYYGTLGVLASTTNNVYGIYDMAGGAYDMVMANYNNTPTNITTMPPAAFLNLYLAPPFGTQPAWSSSSNATYYGFDICDWTLCGGQANYEVNTVQSVTGDSA